MPKNQANVKQHLEAELLLFENCSHSSSTLSSTNNRSYSKQKAKEQVRLYLYNLWRWNENKDDNDHVDTTLIARGLGINLINLKRVSVSWCLYVSNIYNLIHEKVKQHWGWGEKSVAYKKKHVIKNHNFGGLLKPENKNYDDDNDNNNNNSNNNNHPWDI